MFKKIELEKLTHKQMRLALGITMFYAFLTLAHMIYFVSMIAVAFGALQTISFFILWFFPPLALIWLTYFMLMNIYKPEEKK